MALRLRAWAPLAVRAFALGVALLGLAGIGRVASRTEPLPLPAVSRAGLELASLSMHALAAAGSASTAPSRAGPGVVELAASTPSAVPVARGAPGTADAPATPTASAAPAAAAASGGAAAAVVPEPVASSPCPKPASEAASAEGSASPGASASEGRTAGASAKAAGEPVVLNRAGAVELQRLPGVGVKRAEAILALRQRLGRFSHASDLLRVKGIGKKTLERMLPHLVLD